MLGRFAFTQNLRTMPTPSGHPERSEGSRRARKNGADGRARKLAVRGPSITTISRAERGQLALSYEKFSALGRAPRMDMGALFSEAGREAKEFEGPLVTRAGQGVTYRGSSFSYEFLATPAAGEQMNPILGSVKVHFETGEVVKLGRGDSLYFDSRVGHAYVSTSRQLARTVGATTSESNLMRLAKAA
jgi:hypothetical protein